MIKTTNLYELQIIVLNLCKILLTIAVHYIAYTINQLKFGLHKIINKNFQIKFQNVYLKKTV